MFDAATLASFIAIVIGLFLIPGPAVMLILSRTIQGGRKAGILAGLGTACGDFVHTIFAAVGLSALLMTSALAFSIVKYAGAAYLIYLGVRAFLEKAQAPSPTETPRLPRGTAFSQAILAEILNPKTALFFLAFMPQFVHPGKGPVIVQFTILGMIFSGLSAVYSTLLVLSMGFLGRALKRATFLRRWQGKIVGSILIMLGLRVAMQAR